MPKDKIQGKLLCPERLAGDVQKIIDSGIGICVARRLETNDGISRAKTQTVTRSAHDPSGFQIVWKSGLQRNLQLCAAAPGLCLPRRS